MKKIFSFLYLLLWLLPAAAQNVPIHGQCVRDTSVFRNLHFERTIAPTTDLRLFAKYYAALRQGYDGYKVYAELKRQRALDSSLIPDDTDYSGAYNPGTLHDMGNVEKKAPFYDGEYEALKRNYFAREATAAQIEALNNDSLIRWNGILKEQCCEQNGIGTEENKMKRYRRRAEMRDLTRRLEQLRDSAENLPIFFVDIDGKFGGSVRKYVRHLYGKSIMGNMNVLYRFMNKPTIDMIQNDPGVQFAVGLALYEQWIKDVRDGKVK